MSDQDSILLTISSKQVIGLKKTVNLGIISKFNI